MPESYELPPAISEDDDETPGDPWGEADEA